MKTSMLVKSSALFVCLAGASLLVPSENNIKVASCVNNVIVTPEGVESYSVQCALAPQTSWLSWFSGDSSSVQFHFIDLLELLSRFHALPSA